MELTALVVARIEGCLALESSSHLAATTTVICYGCELAWVGMVLTAPEFRRRGSARWLTERVMELVEECGSGTVKLDATEAGNGLYRKFGFAEECEVQRWQRAPDPAQTWCEGPYAVLAPVRT